MRVQSTEAEREVWAVPTQEDRAGVEQGDAAAAAASPADKWLPTAAKA